MTEARVRDLLELPTTVGKRDFVVALTEGVDKAEETVASYVVTPALRDAFDQALSVVGTALTQGRSRAAYLHGSFGSGKSHFMALLSLMLQGRDVVWEKPELHPLRARHAFVGPTKLLELHFHMVGHTSLEEAVFTRYVAFVREHHPEAPIPALYGDERLFDDARRMLDQLGEDAFFAPMNDGAPTAGWGSIAQRFDRARFEDLADSDDPGERAKLFSALVKTWFSSYAEGSRAFIDFDAGLSRMAAHAKALGYDGIVLFLDELMLWLAGRASDVAWLNSEVQKTVKLVEAQETRRDLPFVSFIARQRDLTQLVGEDLAGAENVRLRDSLEWWEGRFDTIVLEDRNLPAIVEKRVRKPRDEDAAAALRQAFDKLKKSATPQTWDIMLGGLDADAFAKLYPFSPALVETLVDLSGSLQRQRTAIRLLVEMLVEHVEDLKPGDVVGVGDVFDLLASGEDSTDGVMKARFESAKQLYKHRLLPLVQERHGTTTAERCQRLRNDHPVKLGCSNCRESACRSDNQLIKTLIMAALVPETAPLKNLTASRLVALNHGALRVPIPGTESSLATQRLRDYASREGQLRVGEGGDPTVKVVIEGVELGPILQQAASYDTEGARQRVLRDLLFEVMGIDGVTDTGREVDVEWRSTRRLGQILFGNVRVMTPEQLRCPDGHDFRLVVDYPFDAPGHGPHEDEEVVEAFIEKQPASWTLVWLPSFFSKQMNDLLGELAILEHILESNHQLRQYLAHLTVDNQARAKLDLDNLRSQKRSRLMKALEEAYGLAKVRESDLDPSQMVERHLRVLTEDAVVHPSLAANLNDAWKRYVEALLEARFPRHPRFGTKLTPARIERLVERFAAIVDGEEKWIAVDRDDHKEIEGTLAQLGLVDTPEGRVRLVEDRTLQQLENRRRAQNVDRPTVSQLAAWLDPSRKMGLQVAARDLVVRCYARWDKRTLVHLDRAYEPPRGKPLPDDAILDKPDLPDHAAWAKALDLAGTLFGIALPGRALHADNLKRFQTQLAAKLEAVKEPVQQVATRLPRRAEAFGIDEAPRLSTARSGHALVQALAGQDAKRQVEVLAAFTPETSANALARALARSPAAASLIDNDLVFGVFDQLRARAETLDGARELLEEAAGVLRQDELNRALDEHLEAAAKRGQALLSGPHPRGSDGVGKPAPAAGTVVATVGALRGREAAIDALRAAIAAIEASPGAIELSGALQVIETKP